jgi:hypothetical protein
LTRIAGDRCPEVVATDHEQVRSIGNEMTLIGAAALTGNPTACPDSVSRQVEPEAEKPY